MNIAIIIGVSKYSDQSNDLPGCQNDAEAMKQVLTYADKFNQILYINENQTSAKTKELLTNFISENKGKQVEEMFFYYTGHGEFTNGEFFYILSDYDSKKRNQTSLQNSEVDDLFRTLSPNLVIKIIDACQSGTSYIKESNAVSKYFNETKTGFHKCYFLNSSLTNQSSYQDRNLSHFTYSFLKSLKDHNADEIRYKDIIDVISDDFEGSQEQTPFFVIQADYTERFCSISKNLKEFLDSIDEIQPVLNKETNVPNSIFDLIRLDAKEYIDKEGAIKNMELIGEKFIALKLDNELDNFFNRTTELLPDFKIIKEKNVIEKWIKNNQNQYFAIPTYKWEYDVEHDHEFEILDGFDLKVDVPFKAISVEFLGNLPNLTSYFCNIVFLLSKKHIRFFYFITDYINQSWDEKYVNTKDIQWYTLEHKLSDLNDILSGVDSINKFFNKRIQKDIDEKFKNFEYSEKTNNEEIKTSIDKV